MMALATLMARPRPASDIVALDRERTYSWQQLRTQVAQLSQWLQQQPGQRWLLYEDDSYRFTCGLLALLHSGKTPLLAPNGQAGLLAELQALCAGRLAVDSCLAGLPPVEHPPPLVELDADALRIEVATSGTTGDATLVSKPLRCFEAELAVQAQLWAQQIDGAVFLATVSHQHIYGLLFRVLLPLCCGRPFWAASHTYPEPLVATIAGLDAPVVLISSPAHLSRLPPALDTAAIAGRVRLLVSSGGPLSQQAAEECAGHFGVLPVEVFGSTETGGVAWRQQQRADQPWRALPGVEVGTREEDGRLWVASPFCAGDEAFLMGDVATLLATDEFQLRGRADRIVKLEEKRLSLTAMERHLQAMPWVERAALVLLPGDRVQLAAVIELTDEGQAQLQADGKRALNNRLKAQLLDHYERVLLPRKWRYVETMPVNSQGKLPQADLRALFSKER